ncbi:hypothetical protein Bca101_059443 [Brassica carinata]
MIWSFSSCSLSCESCKIEFIFFSSLVDFQAFDSVVLSYLEQYKESSLSFSFEL